MYLVYYSQFSYNYNNMVIHRHIKNEDSHILDIFYK